MKIERCYDSHAHFLASSIFEEAILLGNIKNISQLNFNSKFDIVYGFGWTQSWIKSLGLDLKVLDQISGFTKVILSRKDGHAIFVNSNVLEFLNLSLDKLKSRFGSLKGQIGLNSLGELNGFFYEQVAFWIWSELLNRKPDFLKAKLLDSQNLWLKKGFTHVRDMSGTKAQWDALLELEKDNRLKLYLLQNFEYYHGQSISNIIDVALTAKKQQTEHLRVGGIKIFLDGTLGSQTAAISHAYIGCNHGGQLLLSDEELKELTKQVWLADLPVCFHVIGDLGAAQALRIMKQLQNEKIFGQMHLEHLEICSPELIKEMKGQSVQIYFQPSHFLDDVVYLNSILPEPQKSWAFPWLLADEFEIPYFFGFDSPISSIGINRTRDGILHAEKFGIPKPKKDWSLYHSYPDPSWGPNIYTEWNSADQELAFPKIFNLKTNI